MIVDLQFGPSALEFCVSHGNTVMTSPPFDYVSAVVESIIDSAGVRFIRGGIPIGSCDNVAIMLRQSRDNVTRMRA